MYPYLVFLLIFFGAPTLLLGWHMRRETARYRRTALWLLLFVCTAGWFWDWLSWRTGLWRYDTAPTLGVWIAGLPVEEFVGFYVLSTALMFLVVLTVFRRTRHV
ncbi:MAG: lycopene cyclase domain-containing protein [Candidatus Solibacter sp.]|nr:lycopene cyclase domain-containing protein [Candidatus Solibacter sp.]